MTHGWTNIKTFEYFDSILTKWTVVFVDDRQMLNGLILRETGTNAVLNYYNGTRKICVL